MKRKNPLTRTIAVLQCFVLCFIMACNGSPSTVNTPTLVGRTPNVQPFDTPNPTPIASGTSTRAGSKTPSVNYTNGNDLATNGCDLGEPCVFEIDADIPGDASSSDLIATLDFDPGNGDKRVFNDLTAGINHKIVSITFDANNLPGYKDGYKDLKARARVSMQSGGGRSRDVIVDFRVVGYPVTNDISGQTANSTTNNEIQIDWVVGSAVAKTIVEITRIAGGQNQLVDTFEEVHQEHSGQLPWSKKWGGHTREGETYRIRLIPVNAVNVRGNPITITPDVMISALSAVQNFSASVTNEGGIKATWQRHEKDSAGYILKLRKIEDNTEKLFELGSGTTSLDISSGDLTAGKIYKLTIRVKTSTGVIGPEGIQTSITIPAIAAVQSFTAAVSSNGGIHTSWEKHEKASQGYTLKLKNTRDNTEKLFFPVSGTTQYDISADDVTPGTTYILTVRAIANTGLLGPESDEAELVVEDIGQVQNITATLASGGGIHVTWQRHEKAAQGYVIRLTNLKDTTDKFFYPRSNETSYDISSSNVLPGVSYEVRMRAVAAKGIQGSESNEARVDVATLNNLQIEAVAVEQPEKGYKGQISIRFNTPISTTVPVTSVGLYRKVNSTDTDWTFLRSFTPPLPTEHLDNNIEFANHTYFYVARQCTSNNECSTLPIGMSPTEILQQGGVSAVSTPLKSKPGDPATSPSVATNVDDRAHRLNVGVPKMNDAENFSLQRTTNMGSTWDDVANQVSFNNGLQVNGVQTYSDTNLQPCTTYGYRYKESNLRGDTNYSPIGYGRTWRTQSETCESGSTVSPTPSPVPAATPNPSSSSLPEYKQGEFPGIVFERNSSGGLTDNVIFDHKSRLNNIAAVKEGSSTVEQVTITSDTVVIAQRWGPNPASKTCGKMAIDAGQPYSRVVPYCQSLKSFFFKTSTNDASGTIKLIKGGQTYWVKNANWIVNDPGINFTTNANGEKDKIYF